MPNSLPLEFNCQQDQVSGRRSDGRISVLHFAPALVASKTFGSLIVPLKASCATLAKVYVGVAPNFSEKGWNELFREREAAPVLRATRNIHSAALKRSCELDGWRNTMLQEVHPVDPAKEAETRAWLRGLKVGEAARVVLSDASLAHAALSAWHLSGLPDGLRARVEEVAIQHNLCSRYASSYECKPDAANLLARGPDWETAARAAHQAVVNHQADRAEVGQVEGLLHAAIDFVAVVGDVSRQSAFSMISEAA